MPKTLLPFKVSKTNDEITAYSGLALYAEILRGLRVGKLANQYFPKPGSQKGYQPSQYVEPIVLLFLLGGTYLEDIRKLSVDRALGRICEWGKLPSSDGIGNYLKRHVVEKQRGLERLHKMMHQKFLKGTSRKSHTLDIDAFSIFANKDSAQMTYKGEKGYMPIVGHLSELDWCIGYEFREGNVSPNTRILPFLKTCLANLPKGHRVKNVRMDGAGYQSEVFNFLDKGKIKFTITGCKNSDMMREIRLIKKADWRPFKDKNGFTTDRNIAEGFAQMGETDYFRIVIQRWENPNPDLFENSDGYCYHVICTNYSEEEKSTEEIVYWHNGRAASELYHRELKTGFNLHYLPCDHTGANALWFALGILAYNIHIFARTFCLPQKCSRMGIQRLRFEWIQLAGKVVSHARQMHLKFSGLSDDMLAAIHQFRERSWRLFCSA